MNDEHDETVVAEPNAPMEVFPPNRPVPGLDILDVVYSEVQRLAREGTPPAYVFLRTDMYQKAKDANAVPNPDGVAVTPGYISWTDKDLGLHCLIQPLYPGEGQKPFMVAFTHEEAVQIVRASFPRDSFTYMPPATNTREEGEEPITPDLVDVVETNNG